MQQGAVASRDWIAQVGTKQVPLKVSQNKDNRCNRIFFEVAGSDRVCFGSSGLSKKETAVSLPVEEGASD